MNDRSYALPSHWYGDPALVIERNEEHANFAERLQNWVRVAATRRWQSAEQQLWDASRCSSLESHYIGHRDETAALSAEDEQEAKERAAQRAQWTADILDAWRVEDAWRYLPGRHRIVLALVYHRKATMGQICVALPVSRADYPELMRKARSMLRNRLRTMEG